MTDAPNYLQDSQVKMLLANTSLPRRGTGWLVVEQVDEPEPHLMFKIEREKFVTFDHNELEHAKTGIMTIMMKLRNNGIPCFMDKGDHQKNETT